MFLICNYLCEFHLELWVMVFGKCIILLIELLASLYQTSIIHGNVHIDSGDILTASSKCEERWSCKKNFPFYHLYYYFVIFIYGLTYLMGTHYIIMFDQEVRNWLSVESIWLLTYLYDDFFCAFYTFVDIGKFELIGLVNFSGSNAGVSNHKSYWTCTSKSVNTICLLCYGPELSRHA